MKCWKVLTRHKYINISIILITIICCWLIILFTDKNRDFKDIPKEAVVEENKNSYIKVPNRSKEIAEAINKNNETVGWVHIPGTTVDSPVMKGIDNNYYLRKNEEKEYAFEGCIFGDDDSVFFPLNKLSNNLVLHGHNLDDNPDGKRFAQLVKFQNIEFAENTPYIFLTTKDASLVYAIFAVYFSDIKFGYNRVGLNEKLQQSLIDSARKRSEYIYNIEVCGVDKLITLSTCTYKYGEYGSVGQKNTRFVIQGKLLNDNAKLVEKIDLQRNLAPKKPNI